MTPRPPSFPRAIAISSSVTRSIAAERNGTESSMPAIFVLSDASAGSIWEAPGRIKTSSKVNPSLRILAAMTHYTRLSKKVNDESSPTQDGAEIEDGSSVKGAQRAPSRPAVVPCRLYDHRYERRQRREYRTAQGVLETLE